MKFGLHACKDLPAYVKKIEDAFQNYKDQSYTLGILEWFEPLFSVIELFMPAARVSVQGYPNPGSLVLGGIIAVLSITSRLSDYQKRTIQMLAKMGRKAGIFMEYDKDVYKGEDAFQEALFTVYDDILSFLENAVQYLTEGGRIRDTVKRLKLSVIGGFESHLGKYVHDFEDHIDDVQDRALLCDKRRLKKLAEEQKNHDQAIGHMASENQKNFQHHEQLLINLWKREDEYCKSL
jgi:hypothetical protein